MDAIKTMSTDWYFVRDGARAGPEPREQVAALLASGELPPATLVWTAGMANWCPAADTLEFGPVLRGEETVVAPPPVQAPPVDVHPGAYWARTHADAYDAPAQADAADTGPYPWRRWMARLIDTFCYGILLGIVFALVAPDAVEQANPIAMNVLVLALVVPFETVLLGAFGSTPGKRLLRIRVTREDGAPLGLSTAMERSVWVWVRGLGLGLPFVSLFTLVTSFLRLTSEGRTAWDQRLGLRVTHGEMSGPRWAGVVLLLVVVFAVIVAGSMPADV
ncbi:RDD family protein [Longimicrobium sp.]|uniref:RDD family protein n=1 Tax=Longimicrobium sp. TaxID=2029185 RepID=UPI002E2FEDFB|nr:RDD family protein [Longimicrobium sp.]HEX6041503.1 RDD family protein [Longimicrobium sp.]